MNTKYMTHTCTHAYTHTNTQTDERDFKLNSREKGTGKGQKGILTSHNVTIKSCYTAMPTTTTTVHIYRCIYVHCECLHLRVWIRSCICWIVHADIYVCVCLCSSVCVRMWLYLCAPCACLYACIRIDIRLFVYFVCVFTWCTQSIFVEFPILFPHLTMHYFQAFSIGWCIFDFCVCRLMTELGVRKRTEILKISILLAHNWTFLNILMLLIMHCLLPLFMHRHTQT